MTHTNTIIALLSTLIETHQEECDSAPDDGVPHVISDLRNTAARFTVIETNELGIKLTLDDGSEFYIRVNPV